jgi:methyl halide transferase
VNETDWETRYQTGDMPWEKGEAAPGLVDFLAAHHELPRGSVLVPGCGTGHDARAWARAGFNVVGMDLAPSAIRLATERTQAAGLNAQFRLTDFLKGETTETFDWVFEHTLYCAIDPQQAR